MNIAWLGQYTIKLISSGITVIIDPYSSNCGLSPVKGKADLVSLTSPTDESMSATSGISGNPLLISTPGEYSLNQLTILARGWHDKNGQEHNIQQWQIDQISFLHVGAIPEKLSSAQMAAIEKTDIDVLLLPIGGGNSLTCSEALNFLSAIEPKIVIPIHYQLPELTDKLAPVDHFAKEMGINPEQTQPRLSLTANKLPREGMATCLLQP